MSKPGDERRPLVLRSTVLNKGTPGNATRKAAGLRDAEGEQGWSENLHFATNHIQLSRVLACGEVRQLCFERQCD